MRYQLKEHYSQLPIYLLVIWIALLPLVVSTYTLDPVLAPRFISLAAILVILGVWQLTNRKSLVFPTAFWPFLIFIGVEAFSLIGAVNPLEGIWPIARDMSMMGYLLLVFPLIRHSNGRVAICKAFVIANGIVGVVGLYQLISSGALAHPELLYEVKSTLGHRNLFASALVITLPFLVFTAWKSKGWWRGVSLIFIAHSVFLIIILESRTSWLAFAVFVLSYLIWGFVSKLVVRLSMTFWRRLSVVLIGLILCGFVIVHMLNSTPGRAAELKTKTSFSEHTDKTFTIDERLMLWEGSMRMVWNESLLGVGANNWKIMFPAYGSDIWRARQGMVQFQRPHNDYLWVLSETGIVGLLAYLSCFVMILFTGVRAISNSDLEGSQKILVRLLLSGVITYMVVAFFSFPRERIFHQVVLYSMFALIIALSVRAEEKIKRLPSIFSLLVVFMGMFAGYMGYQWLKGEIYARKLNHAGAVGDWEGLIMNYDKVSENGLYRMDATSVPLSFYSGLAYLNLKDFEKAESDFSIAYHQHAYNIHVVNNMAGVLYLQGMVDSSLYYYNKALEISPKYVDGALNLIATYFNSGRAEKAYEVLRKFDPMFQVEAPGNPTIDMYRRTILSEKQLALANSLGDSSVYEGIMHLSQEDLLKVYFESIDLGVDIDTLLIDMSN